MWSLVSLLTASLSYQVFSCPDLYDSVQCEKLCAKLLTLSLVTQCCGPIRDLCSVGIDIYFVRMVFSIQGTWRKHSQGELKESVTHG